MKRIQKSQEREVYYCHAFKEDLQHVIDLMTIDGTPPELTSGEWKFADANELFGFLGDNGNHEITIRSRKPWVRVSATKYANCIRISTDEDSDSSIALVHRVADALKGCETTRPLRSRRWVRTVGPVLVVLVAIGLQVAWSTRQKWVLFLCAAASFIGLLLTLLQLQYGQRSGNCFYGVARNSRKSFWQRKGDDLLVALVGGVIGAVVGAGLGVAGTLYTQAHSTDAPQKSAANTSRPKP